MSFNDLLQRVENLNANAKQDVNTKVRWEGREAGKQFRFQPIAGANEFDLRSIFKASEDIWKRKQLRSDSQWKPRDAVTGAVAKSTVSHSTTENQMPALEPLDRTTATIFDEKQMNVHESKRNVRSLINTFWSNHAPIRLEASDHRSKKPSSVDPYSLDTLEHNCNVMAKHVQKLIAADPSKNIKNAMESALEELDEADSTMIWRKVFPIIDTQKPNHIDDVAVYRNSEDFQRHVINQSTNLLQQIFKDHMETVIKNNLELAKRGGVPGSLSLVEAYLNVRRNDHFQYQDGNHGKHPIWPIIFYCLRIGDFNVAASVAKNLQNVPNCSILINVIMTLKSQQLVDADKRLKLSAEWKHEISSCKDPFKRAVYALILGNDCPEVNDTIENWLWSRLMSCKLDPVNGTGHFHKLQSTICIDCGEDYFVSGAGNFMLYFTALWLTGQIERAIDVLFRADIKHHAVHIAILAYQQQLLITSDQTSAPILAHDSKDPIFCQLNFARLVLLYVKNFELTNLAYALCYCFFLRSIEFDRDGGLDGGNVFEACVSRLCYISGNVNAILGRLSDKGDREPGLIDMFVPIITIHDIVARVARDSDVGGEPLVACRLYVLAGLINDALKICSKQLAAHLTTMKGETPSVSKETDETLRLANWLDKRCKERLDLKLEEANLAELRTLMNLNTFYSAVNEDPHEALAIMRDLNLIPLTSDEMPSRVATFITQSDHVKSVIPDVVVALMEALVKLYTENGIPPRKRTQFQAIANVVLLYVAQINLRFPIHINSRLLQLQSQIC
ncbi:Nuclear pore protein [Aphelenchoides besseyi]|nr:Nuclear pore protein [Aphelenchoides besseyi]